MSSTKEYLENNLKSHIFSTNCSNASIKSLTQDIISANEYAAVHSEKIPILVIDKIDRLNNDDLSKIIFLCTNRRLNEVTLAENIRIILASDCDNIVEHIDTSFIFESE